MSVPLLRRTYRAFVPLLCCLGMLGQGLLVPVAQASRFDPPWQSRVTVDQTTLFSKADRASTPVGPLLRGELGVVTKELVSSDGTAWTEVSDGFVVSSDIAEDMSPW